VLLEGLRAFDAQERHQEQRHHGRAQPVERRADAAVDLRRHLEHAAVDQCRDRQQRSGGGDLRAAGEHGRRVFEQAQAGQHPIDTAIEGIRIERHGQRLGNRARRTGQVWVRIRRGLQSLLHRTGQTPVFAGGTLPHSVLTGTVQLLDPVARPGTGQVWVRTWRCDLEGELPSILGPLAFPSEPPQELAHGHLTDAETTSHLTIGDPLGLPLVHELTTRCAQPRDALGVAPASPQCREAARLEATLVAADRTHVTLEGRCHLVLPRPALLHQADHRVRLPHAVAHRVVRQRQAAHGDHPVPAMGLKTAPLVDHHRCIGEPCDLIPLEELTLICVGFHAQIMAPTQKTGQVWVRTPQRPSGTSRLPKPRRTAQARRALTRNVEWLYDCGNGAPNRSVSRLARGG